MQLHEVSLRKFLQKGKGSEKRCYEKSLLGSEEVMVKQTNQPNLEKRYQKKRVSEFQKTGFFYKNNNK